jgi:hypothetical protein
MLGTRVRIPATILPIIRSRDEMMSSRRDADRYFGSNGRRHRFEDGAGKGDWR